MCYCDRRPFSNIKHRDFEHSQPLPCSQRRSLNLWRPPGTSLWPCSRSSAIHHFYYSADISLISSPSLDRRFNVNDTLLFFCFYPPDLDLSITKTLSDMTETLYFKNPVYSYLHFLSWPAIITTQHHAQCYSRICCLCC